MNDPNAGALSFFGGDHRHCDDLWGAVEAAASKGDAARAKDAWAQYKAAMLRHLSMEEEVLFPALEDATGMHGVGPTAVMRHEHLQIRGLLDQMARSADAGQWQPVLDQGDTLLMLIQQHNVKEEGILYPMADDALRSKWAEIAQALGRYGG